MPGKVIIQTYNKDNFSIEYSKEQNYEKFYKSEIIIREQLKYPPFCDIIIGNISSKNEQETIKVAKYIYQNLKKVFRDKKREVLLFEPIESPISKINNRYRWRILIKCKFNNSIMNSINMVLEEYFNSKYNKARVIFDVNPTNMT